MKVKAESPLVVASEVVEPTQTVVGPKFRRLKSGRMVTDRSAEPEQSGGVCPGSPCKKPLIQSTCRVPTPAGPHATVTVWEESLPTMVPPVAVQR